MAGSIDWPGSGQNHSRKKKKNQKIKYVSLSSVISLVTLHVGGIRLELPGEGSISRLQALWSEKAAGEGREEVGATTF